MYLPLHSSFLYTALLPVPWHPDTELNWTQNSAFLRYIVMKNSDIYFLVLRWNEVSCSVFYWTVLWYTVLNWFVLYCVVLNGTTVLLYAQMLGTPNSALNRGWREPGNSIRDPGFARTGTGLLVLLLYENTWPGHGPCLAETVQNGSRKWFPGLVWECLAGTGSH